MNFEFSGADIFYIAASAAIGSWIRPGEVAYSTGVLASELLDLMADGLVRSDGKSWAAADGAESDSWVFSRIKARGPFGLGHVSRRGFLNNVSKFTRLHLLDQGVYDRERARKIGVPCDESVQTVRGILAQPFGLNSAILAMMEEAHVVEAVFPDGGHVKVTGAFPEAAAEGRRLYNMILGATIDNAVRMTIS